MHLVKYFIVVLTFVSLFLVRLPSRCLNIISCGLWSLDMTRADSFEALEMWRDAFLATANVGRKCLSFIHFCVRSFVC
jgi:hypothetical protein